MVVASGSEKKGETAVSLFRMEGYGEDRVKYCKTDVSREEDVIRLVEFTDKSLWICGYSGKFGRYLELCAYLSYGEGGL